MYRGYLFWLIGVSTNVAICVSIALIVAGLYAEAMALYAIAKRRHIKAPLLAWVPIAKEWILGCISDMYQLRAAQRTGYRRHILLWGRVLLYALFFGRVFGGAVASKAMFIGAAAVGLWLYILRVMAVRNLIASCTGRCAWWVLVLLIFAGIFVRPVCLMIVFLRDDGMPMEPSKEDKPSYMANSGAYARPKRPVLAMILGIMLVLLQLMPIYIEYVLPEPDFQNTALEGLPHYTIIMDPLRGPWYSVSVLRIPMFMRPVPSWNGWYYHPIERFDAFQAVYKEISAEVNERIVAENLERFGTEYALGTANRINREICEELKQRYDIDWCPASDLNGLLID